MASALVEKKRRDIVEPPRNLQLDTFLKGIEGSIWAPPCFSLIPGIDKVGERDTVAKCSVSNKNERSPEAPGSPGPCSLRILLLESRASRTAVLLCPSYDIARKCARGGCLSHC